jgi:hypothetical protein
MIYALTLPTRIVMHFGKIPLPAHAQRHVDVKPTTYTEFSPVHNTILQHPVALCRYDVFASICNFG